MSEEAGDLPLRLHQFQQPVVHVTAAPGSEKYLPQICCEKCRTLLVALYAFSSLPLSMNLATKQRCHDEPHFIMAGIPPLGLPSIDDTTIFHPLRLLWEAKGERETVSTPAEAYKALPTTLSQQAEPHCC